MIQAILTLTALVGLIYIAVRLIWGIDLIEELRDFLEKDQKTKQFHLESLMVVRSVVNNSIFAITKKLEGENSAAIDFATSKDAIEYKKALGFFSKKEKEEIVACLNELIQVCGPERQERSSEELSKIKDRAEKNLKMIDQVVDAI